jgi:hypothetical protein
MKTCVLVLSAPRSGSSCLTGCINLCGVSLGKAPTSVRNQWNSKGYFENSVLLPLHASILKEHGVDMFHAASHRQINSADVKGRLVEAFAQQFDGELFAIKDPRILFMREAYLAALAEFGVGTVKCIHLKREQIHSAASMTAFLQGKKLNPFKAHASYNELLFGDGYEVKFHNLIDEPEQVMRGVCEFIGVDYNPQVEQFVDRGLVHHGSLSDV